MASGSIFQIRNGIGEMNPTSPIPRPAGRTLLIDDRDRVLLFKAVSPDQKEPEIWITPGGALKAGESYEQAALRELWEETGLSDAELGPCVWTRRHVWRWGTERYESTERFFVVRTKEFDVVPAQFDPMEAQFIHGHRWWSVPEIDATTDRETFVPRRLGSLLPGIIAGQVPPQPIEVGP